MISRWLHPNLLVTVAILQLLALTGMAQQTAVLNNRAYPFIRYDLNRIEIPEDTIGWNLFTEKLSGHLHHKKEPVNIVQIGGSHVQADHWTGKVRDNFNQYFNQLESTRGMFFPYRAVKTNGSVQYEVTVNKNWEGYRNVKLTAPGNMGLMGWTATARDSGQMIDVRFKPDSISALHFDRLRIFHDDSAESFRLTVTVADSVHVTTYDRECGCSEVHLPDCFDQFTLTVHRTDTLQKNFVLHGIQTMLNQPLITFHSVGVNGASVGSYLNSTLLEHQLALLNPHLIIFSIGINDSFDKQFTRQTFEASYSELIRRIRSTCPEAVFLFVTNTDSYRKARRSFYKNPKGKEVQQAMHNLALEHCGVVWDLFAVMGGYGSIATWKRHHLAARDLIHLSTKGYRLVGDLFFNALIESLHDKSDIEQP